MVRAVQSYPVEIETPYRRCATASSWHCPTETVYGLGANAQNPAAVVKIFQAKDVLRNIR